MKLSCPTCGFAPLEKGKYVKDVLICKQGHRFMLAELLKGQRRVIRNKVSDLDSAIDEMKVALRAKLSVAGIKDDMERVLECTQDLEALDGLQTILKGFEKSF